MTPSARIQAAIEILDQILAGTVTEQALTGWARRSRFAGSKDRAAVRDHVFDAIRSRRSFAALGGAETGRGLIIGAIRAAGSDPADLFDGSAYGPSVLTQQELAAGRVPESKAEATDLPDWLWPLFQSSLGDQAEEAAMALKHRAPVHLRVNLHKSTRDEAVQSLSHEGITTQANPAADTALDVTEGARRIRGSSAYKDGIVELQDAASQAVVSQLPLTDGLRVLDFCAGGGGKTLAMAARAKLDLFAYDIAPKRLRDLPDRAKRAEAVVQLLSDPKSQAPYDLILCDVPCSGSGSWRRDPDGKWRLTPDDLNRLTAVQADILDNAAALLKPGGLLAYATCSMLSCENTDQVKSFLFRNPEWQMIFQKTWLVHAGADGFFSTQMLKPQVDSR